MPTPSKENLVFVLVYRVMSASSNTVQRQIKPECRYVDNAKEYCTPTIVHIPPKTLEVFYHIGDKVHVNKEGEFEFVADEDVLFPCEQALADAGYIKPTGAQDYNPVKAYVSSKLFLTMMCEFLPARNKNIDLQCFSYNPGTFRSGIYRMQKKWFHQMYQISSPFMKNPVALPIASKKP
ncbi:MAG: hypothetical protein ACWGMZ_09445, partial [Thermoguttaceae bacterium]